MITETYTGQLLHYVSYIQVMAGLVTATVCLNQCTSWAPVTFLLCSSSAPALGGRPHCFEGSWSGRYRFQ